MTNEQLMIQIANLRAENSSLRRKLPGSTKDMRRLRQAHRDAKALLLRRFSGYSISRSECESAGISRRAWPWAIALLKNAGIYDRGDVRTEDFRIAINMLDAEFGSMEQSGTIVRLRAALPPSAK